MLPGRGMGLVSRATAINDYYVCLVICCMETQHNTNCLKESFKQIFKFCILSYFLYQRGQKPLRAVM